MKVFLDPFVARPVQCLLNIAVHRGFKSTNPFGYEQFSQNKKEATYIKNTKRGDERL
jgi:hypothetical protein